MKPIMFYHEMREGHGEDAFPIGSSAYVGVFDGLGGSGTMKHNIGEGNVHTSAYFASRLVARETQLFLDQEFPSGFAREPEDLSKQLKELLIKKLRTFSESHGLELSHRVKSQMLKLLPTTMACGVWRQVECGREIILFWAGDSRVYCLSPSKGLCQLTQDDLTIQQSALDNIYSDAPIANVVNLTSDFYINCRRLVIEEDAMVFAATDGVFNYFESPMALEERLLASLADAKCNSAGEWIELFKQQVLKVAADDATFSCVVPMVESIEALRKKYSDRITAMAGIYSEPMLAIRALLDRFGEDRSEACGRFMNQMPCALESKTVHEVTAAYALPAAAFNPAGLYDIQEQIRQVDRKIKEALGKQHMNGLALKSWNDLSEDEKRYRQKLEEKKEVAARRQRSVMVNKKCVQSSAEFLLDLLTRIEGSALDQDSFESAKGVRQRLGQVFGFVEMIADGRIDFEGKLMALGDELDIARRQILASIDEELGTQLQALQKDSEVIEFPEKAALMEERERLMHRLRESLKHWRNRFLTSYRESERAELVSRLDDQIRDIWKSYRQGYEHYVKGE